MLYDERKYTVVKEKRRTAAVNGQVPFAQDRENDPFVTARIAGREK